jgi:hypothetical protein
MYKLDFTMEELYKSRLLFSIADAIYSASCSHKFEYPHTWDGMNYNQDICTGVRGVIYFAYGSCVGAYQDIKCDSAWYHDIRNGKKTAIEYFQNAPEYVKTLAEEKVLQYLFDETDYGVQPVISTAFWGDGEGLFSEDTFENFQEYTGQELLIQHIKYDQAIKACEENYEFEKEQMELLKSIYALKIANPGTLLTLTKKETDTIVKFSNSEEGMKECETLLNDINIFLNYIPVFDKKPQADKTPQPKFFSKLFSKFKR